MIRRIMRSFLVSSCVFLFFQIYPLHVVFSEVEKPSDTRFPSITVKNGVLFAGDEELFLNAIGYSGIRPGKDQFDPVSDDKFGYAFIEEDMRRIKEAGFNAIRTYALLDEKILELAEKYGLWVVAGIWTEQGTLPHNEAHVQRAIDTIIRDAKIYAKHPNIALLFLSNEPRPDCLYNPVTTKYMRRVVKAAHENCPGVPVSFANMPNAAFVSPEPWDVISFNIYACGFEKFTSSIGYRGLVEGIKKISSGDKPFFISEYGFYAPVPKPNMKEPWIFYRVKDEAEQSKKLLHDKELLSQAGLAGMTMMMWHDDWRNFNDVPSAQAYLQDPPKTKFIHDMFTQEWGGIIAFDEDPVGKPRKAYFDLLKENQAVLLSPDSEMIYKKGVPVKMYISQKVETCDLYVDGVMAGKIARISPHWMEYKLPPFPDSSFKKHELVLDIFDGARNKITSIKRNFWTGTVDIVPQVRVSKINNAASSVQFVVELLSSKDNPMPGKKIQWGIFDVFDWVCYGGEVKTDNEGKGYFSAPKLGVFLVGAGYDFKYKDFNKRCTDLIVSK